MLVTNMKLQTIPFNWHNNAKEILNASKDFPGFFMQTMPELNKEVPALLKNTDRLLKII
jgi:hypothetical protein